MKENTMGTMISSLRKDRGMTQADLAEKMNVTDKAVSKWERDLSFPDINSLPRLAEILGVSVDELIKAKEHGEEKAENGEINKIVKTILKAIPIAMGVAVTVLSVMKKIDMYSGFTMMGIGLACVGISLMQSEEK